MMLGDFEISSNFDSHRLPAFTRPAGPVGIRTLLDVEFITAA